jgi:hypothetical protein
MTSSTVIRCPSCKREVEPPVRNRTFPFCSERCRTIDLGRWLGEEFRLSSNSPDDDEDGSVAPAPARAPDA